MIARVLRRLGWRDLCWFAVGVALIVLMRRDLLGYEQQLAEVTVPAALGRRVAVRDFAVTVDGFQLARSYRVADGGTGGARVLRTPGIWVSVPLRIEMLREPGVVTARLRTRDGLSYRSNGDQRPALRDANVAGRQILPGLPLAGRLFFEVPPGKLPGAHLQLFHGASPPSLDAVVDVDLGIDEAALARVPDETELSP